MKALTSPAMLYLKGTLFVLLGVAAAFLVIIRQPTLQTAVLLIVALWSFCRAYYFAFYVIERYIDPSYRFSGLFSFVRYVWARGSVSRPDSDRS